VNETTRCAADALSSPNSFAPAHNVLGRATFDDAAVELRE
jgi:hypothetical protein